MPTNIVFSTTSIFINAFDFVHVRNTFSKICKMGTKLFMLKSVSQISLSQKIFVYTKFTKHTLYRLFSKSEINLLKSSLASKSVIVNFQVHLSKTLKRPSCKYFPFQKYSLCFLDRTFGQHYNIASVVLRRGHGGYGATDSGSSDVFLAVCGVRRHQYRRTQRLLYRAEQRSGCCDSTVGDYG